MTPQEARQKLIQLMHEEDDKHVLWRRDFDTCSCGAVIGEERDAVYHHLLGVEIDTILAHTDLLAAMTVPRRQAERLSKMLWDARELAEMYADVVEARTGKVDAYSRRVVREIDEFRAEQGWSPDGFGGEDHAHEWVRDGGPTSYRCRVPGCNERNAP